MIFPQFFPYCACISLSTYFRKLNMYYMEVSCFLLFLIHISIIGYYQLYPTETSTKLSERKLDDLDFPVLFKICLNPAFNEDKIKEVGYYSLWSYFTGKGRWRNSNGSAVYGWAGHWENGSTISSVKGEPPIFLFLFNFFILEISTSHIVCLFF